MSFGAEVGQRCFSVMSARRAMGHAWIDVTCVEAGASEGVSDRGGVRASESNGVLQGRQAGGGQCTFADIEEARL